MARFVRVADNDRWNSGIGTSTNTCSDVYKGAAAESAPEIRITTDYYRTLRPINGAIDFHSYGQVHGPTLYHGCLLPAPLSCLQRECRVDACAADNR